MSRPRRGILPQRFDPRRPTPPPGERPGPPETELVELDVSSAVLADEVAISVASTAEGKVWVLELTGRVNHTEDRAALPFLLGPDVAGLIVGGFIRAAKLDPEMGAAVRDALRDT